MAAVTSRRRQLSAASVACLVLAYAWIASGVRTFTRPAEALTFLPVFAVLAQTLAVTVAATVRPRPPAPSAVPQGQQASSRRWGALPWAAALLAIVGWELISLFQQPRDQHPTLSSITDSLLSTHASRFAGYLLWLFLGWQLVSNRRRRQQLAGGRP